MISVDYNLTQITLFVYVSDGETARQCQQIVFNGIRCVINVACELPHIVFPPQYGIESIKYPIANHPDFPANHYFDIIADHIAINIALNRRTLIYCYYGQSRSTTFILAYLIKYHHLPLLIAFKLVQKQRPLALSNIAFWIQLKFYEFYQNQKNSLQKISNEIKQLFNIFTIHKNQMLF